MNIQGNISKNFDVLTRDGWKKFEDLIVGEEIFTLNLENGFIEFNKIDQIIKTDYEDIIYNVFSTRGIKSSFSRHQEFLIEDRYKRTKRTTIEEIYNNRVNYRHSKIIKLGRWNGIDTRENFIIKGISETEGINFNRFTNDIRKDLEVNYQTFCAFLGLWLAEGHLSSKKYSVNITQKKPQNLIKIRELLNKFPIPFTEHGKDKKTFQISDMRLYRFLKPLGICYDKYIPHEIKQTTSENLKELIDWYILGDGRNFVNPHGNTVRNFFSTSRRLVEDLHECVIKSGLSGNWTIIDPSKKPDYTFAGHLIKSENKSPLYQLNVSSTSGIWLDNRHINIEKEDYSGSLHSIVVKNSNFYMKENNKSFWIGSGNFNK